MIRILKNYVDGEHTYLKVIEPLCKKYNLTHIEANIIMFLYNNPNYNTASLISKYKRLAKSHVSTTLQCLLEKGLLKREYEGNNKKTIYLYLLDDGITIAKEGKVLQEKFKDIVLKGFTSSEINTLFMYLDRIDKNLLEYN